MKIADIIRRGIAVGASNEDILAAVRETHPTAKTNAACIAYYRSKEKKVHTAEARPIAKAVAAASGAPTYAVKGIKTFVGMEGHGYNATLYRDGKPVAFVIDDASGGPLQVEWKDCSAPRAEVTTRTHAGEPWVVRMTPEERRLHEHASSLPAMECEWPDPATGRPASLEMTSELFIEGLVNDAILLRDVAKMTRGKVAFVRDGKLFTAKCEPTEANIARVRAGNPGAVVLNGMDDLAVLATVRALQ